MGVLPHTQEQNTQPILKQFAFDGAWIPDVDPSKIGENNFALLRNFRYDEAGIAPIEGITKLTANPVNATYKYPKDAVQLRSPLGDYIVGVYANVDDTAQRVYYRSAAIPDTGDWETASIFTPNTAYQQARMSYLPRGVGYSNEVESAVWEGPSALPGAIWVVESITNLTATNPINYTLQVRNTYTDVDNIFTVDSQFNEVIIGTTRPMDSTDIVVVNPNGNASVCTGTVWTATGWESLTLTDGTDTGGASLSKSGTLSWTEDTESDTDSVKAIPAYFEGTYLYLYKFTFSGSISATVSYFTVNMKMQQIKDVWDGVYRTCIAAEVSHVIDATTRVQDFLLEINEPSNIEYPIAMTIGQLATTDYIELAFEEQTGAVLFEMIAAAGNTNTGYFSVYYWDGTGYTSVGTVYDGTLDPATGKSSLNRTGTISWVPPDKRLEKIRTRQGVTGYFYRFVTNGTFSGADVDGVLVDLVSGIPAPRIMKGHKFPTVYGQRSFWCGDIMGNEVNAMDYGPPNTIDVYNGMQSSDRGQRIYVGDQSELTGSASIYNRFGSSIYETMLIFKHSSTHLLYGTGPGDYNLYTISQSYGCPAPNTIASAEIGYEMSAGAYRNVCLWMSYRGPMIFDGATMIPLPGVDLYFDPRKTETFINMDYIHLSEGWFDPYWQEYHLVIPSGPTATKLNVHIVYDLKRKKWYEVYYDGGSTTTGTGWPQVALNVRETSGAVRTFILMDDGHLYRYGYGSDWDGTDILHRVRTGDFFIGESIWIESKMQALRVGHEMPDFELSSDPITISINYYPNGSESGVALDDLTISRDDQLEEVNLLDDLGAIIYDASGNAITFDLVNQFRYAVKTQHINKVALTHQFEFSRTSTSTSFLGNFGKNFLWWGFLARPEGMDMR